MGKSVRDTFRRLYDLYAGDLSISEMEHLVKRDAPGVYDFYVREVKAPDDSEHPFIRAASVAGNLFLAFLSKMAPVRRIIYSAVGLLFVFALFENSWFWAVVAFALLNLLLAFELADKLTAKDELEVAREIQMGLMPAQPPSTDRFDIACFSEAAREVGGDYFDFIQPATKEGKTYVTIGDVSGKGMGAALYMVQVQAILKHLVEQHDTPKQILGHLNKNLRHILKRGAFFTVTLASFSADSVLKLCRAGHMPLIHYRIAENDCFEVVPGGMAIGFPGNGTFDKELEQVSLRSRVGDVFCFYTDGVVETMNARREMFDEQLLKKTICAHAHESAEQIKEAILTDVALFRGSTPAYDDLTLIIMKRC